MAMAGVAAMATAASSVQEKPVFNDQQKDILHDPLGAAAAVCCLLMDNDEQLREQQMSSIFSGWPELHAAMLISPWKNLCREDFLPVVELSTSALRRLGARDYTRLKHLLLSLMKVDGVIDIYEWSLYYLLKSTVDCYYDKAIVPRPRYKKVQDIEVELKTVIAMLVQSTQQNEVCKHRAFERAYAVCGMNIEEGKALPAVTMHQFNAAMRKLANAYPLLKARVLKALVDAAKSDGEIEMTERHLIMAIGAAIDTPVFNLDMPHLS